MTPSSIKGICLQLLDSVLAPQSCLYVAGPLNTGRQFYDLLARGVASPVVRPKNEAALTAFADTLRRRVHEPVIDSGRLSVPSWSGADYSEFFLDVIARYVRQVWFLDGWEYSHGATKEFVLCHSRGIQCLNQAGAPLSREAGMLLIAEAVTHVESLGLDASKLRRHLPSER
jgi:hypothetical protein